MLDAARQHDLLGLARDAVHHRVRSGQTLSPPARDWPAPLAQPGASFVTVNLEGRLRGCCGSIEAHDALANDVWRNAQRSACEDPRFPPMGPSEAAACTLDIAILGPLEPLAVDGEQALLAVLRPGVDGLLMSLTGRRATFLPKVWEKLPDPESFLLHLKHKLGVSPNFWDDGLVFHRYTTEEISSQRETA